MCCGFKQRWADELRLLKMRCIRYNHCMKIKAFILFKLSAFLFCLGIGLAGVAHAQWGWTDKDGRRIFSDKAPASEVPEKSIFKRPTGTRATPTGVTKEETSATPIANVAGKPMPSASASRVPSSGAASGDPALEKKKKELEVAEAAKQKAEKEKLEAAKADNCARAKKSKITLNSGTRMATTNDKGEREIMGEAERAASAKRADDVIASECK